MAHVQTTLITLWLLLCSHLTQPYNTITMIHTWRQTERGCTYVWSSACVGCESIWRGRLLMYHNIHNSQRRQRRQLWSYYDQLKLVNLHFNYWIAYAPCHAMQFYRDWTTRHSCFTLYNLYYTWFGAVISFRLYIFAYFWLCTWCIIFVCFAI